VRFWPYGVSDGSVESLLEVVQMAPLAMMWTPGIAELVVILVIVVIFFGVGKLPQVGKALGQAIGGFRQATEEDPGKLGDK